MPIIRSSTTAVAASGLPLEHGGNSAAGHSHAWPRPTALLPPRCNGKPEAATAVVELLMMGMRTPETCWAVFNHLDAELNPICHLRALLGAHHILHVSRIRVKRQVINLRNCCIWVVDSFEMLVGFFDGLASLLVEWLSGLPFQCQPSKHK